MYQIDKGVAARGRAWQCLPPAQEKQQGHQRVACTRAGRRALAWPAMVNASLDVQCLHGCWLASLCREGVTSAVTRASVVLVTSGWCRALLQVLVQVLVQVWLAVTFW